jgi:hypothetical protein
VTTRRPLQSLAVVGVLTVAMVSASVGSARAAGTTVPFKDPAAHGYIALCDLAGNNVTSGSVDSKPFAWKAVSSTPPPAGFGGFRQQAVLEMYQPRKDIPPSLWNGDELTASTYYKSSRHPVVDATYKDFSLANFIKEFPSQVDGLYQLRFHYTKPNAGISTETYPAAVIQVTGSSWRIVQGGTANCSPKATIARSSEYYTGVSQLDPKHSASETAPTAAPSTQPSVAPSTTANGSASGSASPGHAGDQPISAPVSGAAAPSSSSSVSGAVIGLSVLCGVLIVVLVVGALRRRRQSSTAK